MDRGAAWIFNLGAAGYAFMTDQPAWRASCAALAERLPAAARLVLDLGCGPGGTAAAVARARPAARVVALDLAPAMLGQARRAAARRGLAGRIAPVRADAARLPFPAERFDAVVGHSFLYLVPDRAGVLAEARRVLRPGGRVVFLEPTDEPFSWRAVLAHSRDPRFLASVLLWRPFSRIHGRFSRAALAAALRAAGFTNVQVAPALAGLGVLGAADRAEPMPAEAPADRARAGP